jgi:hypothetical protein
VTGVQTCALPICHRLGLLLMLRFPRPCGIWARFSDFFDWLDCIWVLSVTSADFDSGQISNPPAFFLSLAFRVVPCFLAHFRQFVEGHARVVRKLSLTHCRCHRFYGPRYGSEVKDILPMKDGVLEICHTIDFITIRTQYLKSYRLPPSLHTIISSFANSPHQFRYELRHSPGLDPVMFHEHSTRIPEALISVSTSRLLCHISWLLGKSIFKTVEIVGLIMISKFGRIGNKLEVRTPDLRKAQSQIWGWWLARCSATTLSRSQFPSPSDKGHL